jgi:hypothetical protein
MSTTDEYNGWTNRETWALNLWLSNDPGLYDLTRERVIAAAREYTPGEYGPDTVPAYYIGDAVKNLWEEITDPGEQLVTATEILSMVREVGSVWRVNWDEIGAAWMPESDGDE